MHKLLLGAGLIATVFGANMTSAIANPKVESLTMQKASPNLVEIEGRSLTDGEAMKIEGQVSRIMIPRNPKFGICVIGVVSPCNGNGWQFEPPSPPRSTPRRDHMGMPIALPFPIRPPNTTPVFVPPRRF